MELLQLGFYTAQMQGKRLGWRSRAYPKPLKHIPQPPKQLFYCGSRLEELLRRPRLAIVGSRNVSPYGKQVTMELAGQLAEQGIVIISGLALGVDGLAHEATLAAEGLAIAVLPGPIEDIVPAQNFRLAEAIVESGGALISEYQPGSPAFKQNFIARNRLVAGLAQAVLITEAAEKSGSLYTADFARQQHKQVLAVPGNIHSPGSAGTNNLIQAGATLVTSCNDVLTALGIEPHRTHVRDIRGHNEHEQLVLDLLASGMIDANELLSASRLSVQQFNQILTMLEMAGQIRSLGHNQWGLH